MHVVYNNVFSRRNGETKKKQKKKKKKKKKKNTNVLQNERPLSENAPSSN